MDERHKLPYLADAAIGQTIGEVVEEMANPAYEHMRNPYTGEYMYDSAGNPVLVKRPVYQRPARNAIIRFNATMKWAGWFAAAFVTFTLLAFMGFATDQQDLSVFCGVCILITVKLAIFVLPLRWLFTRVPKD